MQRPLCCRFIHGPLTWYQDTRLVLDKGPLYCCCCYTHGAVYARTVHAIVILSVIHVNYLTTPMTWPLLLLAKIAHTVVLIFRLLRGWFGVFHVAWVPCYTDMEELTIGPSWPSSVQVKTQLVMSKVVCQKAALPSSWLRTDSSNLYPHKVNGSFDPRKSAPNGTSIISPVFAQLTCVPKRQTDTHTTLWATSEATVHLLCTACRQCGLIRNNTGIKIQLIYAFTRRSIYVWTST